MVSDRLYLFRGPTELMRKQTNHFRDTTKMVNESDAEESLHNHIQLNKAFENYLSALSFAPSVTPALSAAEDLVYHLVVALSLKSSEVEKLRMQIQDGTTEGTPPTANQNLFTTVKDLGQPPSVRGAGGQEINREPQPGLDTAGVNCREKFGGANVEESRWRHRGKPEVFYTDSLTRELDKLEQEIGIESKVIEHLRRVF